VKKSTEQRQREVCDRYRVEFCPPGDGSKLGVARNIDSRIQPLNGLRHPAVRDTCGWYIWRGEELQDADDYFQPMHVAHLSRECPEALAFLGLPAGWRFLIAEGQVDVWYDETLLRI
jgi:hypothetical protein